MSAVLLVLMAMPVTMVVLFLWLRLGRAMPLDVANDRSLHAGTIPRIGGIAMAAGIAMALVAAPVVAGNAVLLAAAGLWALSLADDWRALPVVPRLIGHVAAASVAVWSLDLPLPVAIPAVLALVWMTNLYNFMDGADGLAGGMTMIGFGAYAIAAWPEGHAIAAPCIAIAAAAAGFLAFNFPPARVFMGDAGSIPLGFLAGALGLAGWQAGVWPWWFPLLVFSPFVADATVTLLRRLFRQEKVWQAHRQHAYQRLVLAGWSHCKLSGAAGVVMAAAAGTALWMRTESAGWAGAALLAWAVCYGWLFFMIDRLWIAKRSSSAPSPASSGN